MAGRIRTHPWAATPFGEIETWPDRLRFVLDMALASSFPTAIYWGPELRLLYNDAWAPIPAERHPWALGRPGAEVWADIWDVVGPQIEAVLASGRGFATYDQHLRMVRDGVPCDTWWNYSFTAIRGDDGQVLGVLNQGNETTRVVLAERARRREVERLRELFDQAPAAVALVTGPRHVFEFANPAYQQLIGGREILGRPVADALPEVIEQGYGTLLDRVFRTGETYRADNTPVLLQRSADEPREQRILDFVYQPVRGADGRVSGIFVSANDVTQRARAEEAARASAEELREATETQAFLYTLAEHLRQLDSQDAILRETAAALARHLGADRVGFYRVDGDVLRLGACTTDGRLPALGGTLPITTLTDAVVDRYRGGRTLIVTDAARDPQLAGTQFSALTPAAIGVPLLRGGEWVATLYVNHADPRAWQEDEVAFVEGVAEIAWDAVERATALGALRESEEKFRAIANSIDQMVWSTRPDGHHDYFNRRWSEFTGLPPGASEGGRWIDSIHPDDRARTDTRWQACLRTGETYHIEYRLRHRSGIYRWVLARAKPMRDPGGQISRWFGTCTDIQEIVDAREVLARSREELEAAVRERTERLMAAEEQLRQAQKMEAVGQLTGGIAHDFNNMLAVVIGGLDLLERRLRQGRTDVGRYLDAARDGATRAAALTQRLLAFSRRQPLAPRRIDANAMIGGMIDLLVRTLGEGVVVETKPGLGLRAALADPNQLENALLNLCVNARDAMPEGGLLTLATRNATLTAAQVAGWGIDPGDYVEIAVADTGTGMPPDVAARAFDPFFTTKGVGKGTGLGLSQVYGFVTQSGGSVRIESAPGAGTTVRLFLPAQPGVAAQPGPPPERPPFAGARPGEVVLVVEDEERVRTFSTEALRELGYQVIEAASPAEALRILDMGRPVSLLFSDVVMPEMNGHALAHEARRRLPALRVLLTSGYAPESVEADRADILPKPFDVDQLARRVRAVLDA